MTFDSSHSEDRQLLTGLVAALSQCRPEQGLLSSVGRIASFIQDFLPASRFLLYGMNSSSGFLIFSHQLSDAFAAHFGQHQVFRDFQAGDFTHSGHQQRGRSLHFPVSEYDSIKDWVNSQTKSFPIRFERSVALALKLKSTHLPDAVNLIHESPALEHQLELLWPLVSSVMSASANHVGQLHADKMEAMAEFAAGAGHEINNPLGSIIGRTSLLMKSPQGIEEQRMLETVGAQAYRIRDMIGDTMLFGRPPVPTFGKLNLLEIIQTFVGRFRAEAAAKGIAVNVDCAPEHALEGDAHQLLIVLTELYRNASALENNCRSFEITANHLSIAGVSGTLIQVRNDGRELSEVERIHCFEPFYSGSQAGRGLGFGLSKSWQICRSHGGFLELYRSSSPVEFRVWLPTKSPTISEA